MKHILDSKGNKHLLDDEDYEWAKEYKWCWQGHEKARASYAINRRLGGEALHRLIWIRHYGKYSKKYQIDHIDGNSHNNQKSNLRLATLRQNLANQPRCRLSFDPSSKYKGVSLRKDIQKWEAGLWNITKRLACGVFLNEEHAARAHDIGSLAVRGWDYAWTNFPKEEYLQFKGDIDEITSNGINNSDLRSFLTDCIASIYDLHNNSNSDQNTSSDL